MKRNVGSLKSRRLLLRAVLELQLAELVIQATLREQFDVVLVVGDPILTGISATVIAPQTDGVVLTVARGQQPQRVMEAVRRMEMLGTSLAVATFNRADPSDLPIDAQVQEAADKTKHRAWPSGVR